MNSTGIKSRVLQSLHNLIAWCWVAPLQRALPRLEAMESGWRRRVLLGGALVGANLGGLVITDFRVHVRRLKGTHWSVVYIGTRDTLGELRHILFPELVSEEELFRSFLWQMPALAKRFARGGELVVCELNQIIRWRPSGKYVFTIPSWVRQVLDITRPVEDIQAGMNQNMRRNVRKMQREGFDYVVTKEDKDFDLFYHRMYCPYLRERFGERTFPFGYEPLLRQFHHGGLLLVRHAGEPVSGMLYRIIGGTCQAEQMGVLDGRFDYVERGANVALWWFMMEWARGEGLSRFDLGASRALTADGIFNFKRQWGARVALELDVHAEWVFYGEDLSHQLRDYLNQRGFISRVGSLHYLVVLPGSGKEPSEDELARRREDAARCGLEGILLIRPGMETAVNPERTGI